MKERAEGVGPDAVTLLHRVEEVGHHGGGEGAVGLEKAGVEVEPDDAAALGEAADDGVRPLGREQLTVKSEERNET